MSELRHRLEAALDGYSIERPIGEGGMAEVFLAEDLKHNRQVALKVLKPEVAQSLGTERFLREIDTAAKLSHPHILPLLDSGEADGLLYLVMPFVEGETLRERLDREGRLPLHAAVTIASEVADALAYAHDRGLVHRDIKPENILFQSGHAAVTDFGIAVPTGVDAHTRLTRTGVAVGTVAYMSPEQAAGDREIDARSDLYALGCILFEMLESRQPFAGQSPQAVLASKLTGRIPEFTRSDDLPETVRPVLDRALAPNPGDRQTDARHFATELQTAVTAVEIEAARDRRRRRALKRRAWAGVAFVLVALAGWWTAGTLTRPEIGRVAVLPFENEQTDPEQASLLAGMHDALIGEMQQAGMEVIGRRSVIRYLGDTTPIGEIARELGVDVVFEGRAQYREDSVSVSLTMVDGGTQAARWSGTFATPTRSVIRLYREATRAIAEEIDLELRPEAAAHLATTRDVNPEAYQLVLRANYHWSRLTPQDLEVAQGLYEEALDLDPDNAPALAGLGRVWGGRTQFGLADPTVVRPLIRDYMRRAIDIAPDDPGLVAWQASTITWTEWDWEGGQAAFERAIDLNPNNWEARAFYSHLLSILGDTEEAMAQAGMAREGDPFGGLVLGLACGTSMANGFYEAAVEECREALALDPSQPVAYDIITHSLRELGREAAAVRHEAGLFESLGDTVLSNALLTGLDEGGPTEASARAARLLEARAELTYVSPFRIGAAWGWAGQTERSLDWLERAEEDWDPQMPYVGVRPMPEAVTAHPRFQAILDRMGVPNLHTERGR